MNIKVELLKHVKVSEIEAMNIQGIMYGKKNIVFALSMLDKNFVPSYGFEDMSFWCWTFKDVYFMCSDNKGSVWVECIPRNPSINIFDACFKKGLKKNE